MSGNQNYPQRGATEMLSRRGDGNAYRDAWLAQRSEDEMRQLDALAASEGLKLQPATILRPILVVEGATNIVGGQVFSLSYYFPFYAYVRRVTSSVRQLRFKQNQEPDASTIGNLDTRVYFNGMLSRPNGDQLFTRPASLDQWSGSGEFEYVFDLIPFVTLGDRLNVEVAVSDVVDTVSQLQITFHCMRFPIEGV